MSSSQPVPAPTPLHVTVAARFRPLNALEIKNGGRCAVSSQTDNSVQLSERADARSTKGLTDATGTSDRAFTFDRVFSTLSTQEQVYAAVGKPVTDAFMSGFNACLLAYGQTGSGKTHTMMGPSALLERLSGEAPVSPDGDDDEDMRDLVASAGVTPRVIFDIFDSIEKSPAEMQYTLEVTMVEIYMEKVRDLLDPSPEKANLSIMTIDGQPVVVGATRQQIGSHSELFALLKRGNEARIVASTAMNDVSSRSHSIFSLKLTTLDARVGTRTQSILHLCDLAGSESVGKTNVGGLQLAEAGMINKSLCTLALVINKLTDTRKGAGDAHIPYSSSMLTRILRASLGGNSKTALILTASPAEFNSQETLSTLRFGLRAKTIKQTAVLNVERTPAELRKTLEALEPRFAAAAAALMIAKSALAKGFIKAASGSEGAGAVALLNSRTAAVFESAPRDVYSAAQEEAGAAVAGLGQHKEGRVDAEGEDEVGGGSGGAEDGEDDDDDGDDAADDGSESDDDDDSDDSDASEAKGTASINDLAALTRRLTRRTAALAAAREEKVTLATLLSDAGRELKRLRSLTEDGKADANGADSTSIIAALKAEIAERDATIEGLVRAGQAAQSQATNISPLRGGGAPSSVTAGLAASLIAAAPSGGGGAGGVEVSMQAASQRKSGFFSSIRRIFASPPRSGAASNIVADATGGVDAPQSALRASHHHAAHDFFVACEKGDYATVRRLLEEDAARVAASGTTSLVNAVDRSGRTGLLYAARGGSLQVRRVRRKGSGLRPIFTALTYKKRPPPLFRRSNYSSAKAPSLGGRTRMRAVRSPTHPAAVTSTSGSGCSTEVCQRVSAMSTASRPSIKLFSRAPSPWLKSCSAREPISSRATQTDLSRTNSRSASSAQIIRPARMWWRRCKSGSQRSRRRKKNAPRGCRARASQRTVA